MRKVWNKLFGREPGSYAAVSDMADAIAEELGTMSFASVDPLDYVSTVILSTKDMMKQLDVAIAHESGIIEAAGARLREYNHVREGYEKLHKSLCTNERTYSNYADEPDNGTTIEMGLPGEPVFVDGKLADPFIVENGQVVMRDARIGVVMDQIAASDTFSTTVRANKKRKSNGDNPAPVE